MKMDLTKKRAKLITFLAFLCLSLTIVNAQTRSDNNQQVSALAATATQYPMIGPTMMYPGVPISLTFQVPSNLDYDKIRWDYHSSWFVYRWSSTDDKLMVQLMPQPSPNYPNYSTVVTAYAMKSGATVGYASIKLVFAGYSIIE